MAKIKVNDINPTGADLFDDSESFMNELSTDELEQAMGGLSVFSEAILSIYKGFNISGISKNPWGPVIL